MTPCLSTAAGCVTVLQFAFFESVYCFDIFRALFQDRIGGENTRARGREQGTQGKDLNFSLLFSSTTTRLPQRSFVIWRHKMNPATHVPHLNHSRNIRRIASEEKKKATIGCCPQVAACNMPTEAEGNVLRGGAFWSAADERRNASLFFFPTVYFRLQE